MPRKGKLPDGRECRIVHGDEPVITRDTYQVIRGEELLGTITGRDRSHVIRQATREFGEGITVTELPTKDEPNGYPPSTQPEDTSQHQR